MFGRLYASTVFMASSKEVDAGGEREGLLKRKENVESNDQQGANKKRSSSDRLPEGSGMNDEPSDAQLVVCSREGDRSAYQALVKKYEKRAFHIALDILRSREDAEDVTQEAFVKAYLSLKSFRGQSSFYTWLYRIVFNMAIDLKRKVARRGGPPAELEDYHLNSSSADASLVLGTVENPATTLSRKEQATQIRRALDTLSDEHRTVITLREFDGLSYDEIADIVGVSKGTVMSRLHYARKKMQSVLSEYYGSSGGKEGGEEVTDPATSEMADR